MKETENGIIPKEVQDFNPGEYLDENGIIPKEVQDFNPGDCLDPETAAFVEAMEMERKRKKARK